VNRGRAPSKPTAGTVRCWLAAGGESQERTRLRKMGYSGRFWTVRSRFWCWKSPRTGIH